MHSTRAVSSRICGLMHHKLNILCVASYRRSLECMLKERKTYNVLQKKKKEKKKEMKHHIKFIRVARGICDESCKTIL